MFDTFISGVVELVRSSGYSFGPSETPSTYLGPIRHRSTNLSFTLPHTTYLRKLDTHPDIHDNLLPLYVPDEFDSLVRRLRSRPLRRKGMNDSPEKNLEFLKQESFAWTVDPLNRGGSVYAEMWADIPNTSEYAETASANVSRLSGIVPSLIRKELTSDTRSFELRFDPGYCPVVWSIMPSSNLSSLEASLVFRSLEVSRNFANDLYLFFIYFGYVFSMGLQDTPIGHAISIERINLFSQDAHIIDFQ